MLWTSILLGLSACGTFSRGEVAIPTGTTSEFCRIYEPIFVDRTNDTSGTLRQVDRMNGVFVALCQDDPPPE